MLRCAGCGELVSQWAARCPNCLRTTDDAAEVDPVPAGSTAVVAHDGEAAAGAAPRSRVSRRARLRLVGAAGVLVAAGATIAVAGLPPAAPGGANRSDIFAPPRSPPGRVVSEAQDGTLFVSYPDGSHRRLLRSRPFRPADAPLLVDGGTTVVALAGAHLGESFAATETLAGFLPPGSTVVQADPFSDGAGAVVVESGRSGPAVTATVSVVRLSDRHRFDLGEANDAAGDPLAPGAFVTVAADIQPSRVGSGIGGLADSRVELRDSGQPAHVLATAAELNRDVEQDPRRPVNLTVFPDALGQKLVVMLNPTVGGESDSALVVLDRTGRVLGTVGADLGPVEHTTPYWSPDGRSLAYATFGPVGTMLAVLDASYHVATQGLQTPTAVDGCTWSPDSAWVLCQAVGPDFDNWLLATNDSTLTPIYSLPARGSPVAWVAG